MNIDIDDNDIFFIKHKNKTFDSNYKKTNVEAQSIRVFLKQKLDISGVCVYGYNSDKQKLRLHRYRYNSLIETITGYNLNTYQPLTRVIKMYEELVKFNIKHKEQLEREPLLDIRNYICYYSKCLYNCYHYTYEEFTHLIMFFEILIVNFIPLYDFL